MQNTHTEFPVNAKETENKNDQKKKRWQKLTFLENTF